jgi:hypothetical protein
MSVLKIIFTLFLALGIRTIVHSQDMRAEADTFAMKMVQMLIEHDCGAYPALYDDTVYMLQKSQAIVKSEMYSKIEMLCKASVRDQHLTLNDYLKNFDRTLLNAKEFKQKGELYNLIKAHPYFELGENDFLFIGYRHKTEDYMKYLLDDPFCVIFRKFEDGFRIVLLAGN